MTEPTTKAKETLVSMRNANKHLTEILGQIERMDAILARVSMHLSEMASRSGEMQMEVWHDNKWMVMKQKQYLNNLKALLDGARP